MHHCHEYKLVRLLILTISQEAHKTQIPPYILQDIHLGRYCVPRPIRGCARATCARDLARVTCAVYYITILEGVTIPRRAS